MSKSRSLTEARKKELEAIVEKYLVETTDTKNDDRVFPTVQEDVTNKNQSREPWLQMINEEHRAAELEMLVEQMVILNENKAILMMLKPIFKEAGKQIVPILIDLLKDAGKDVVEELITKLAEKAGGAA